MKPSNREQLEATLAARPMGADRLAFENSREPLAVELLLSESQRALVGARMANLKKGGDRKSGEIKAPTGGLISVERAAELSGSSRKNIERAKLIIAEAVIGMMAAYFVILILFQIIS